MHAIPIEHLADCVGFDSSDAGRLERLGPLLAPHLPEIADKFYTQLTATPQMQSLFTGGEPQMRHLRDTLCQWMRELFGGQYGSAYWENRLRIGHTHVRIGLPQYYMFTAMETIRAEFDALLPTITTDIAADRRALSRLLTLETAVMLESYKTSYTVQVRDTERSAMHEELSEAEHLAQIGRLSAALAHEIKNPLAGISGAIQVIREPLAEEHPHRPILTEILRQIDRLDTTVKDLLVYARPRPARFQRLNLARIINRVTHFLGVQPDAGANSIHSQVAPTLELYADDVQLEQLLVNLLLNASQAAPDGGTIELTAVSDHEDILITVRDEGPGIPEDIRQQIFEPFYTTKSRGTGLGLPICRRIVEAHSGSIEIDCPTGGGTQVSIRLPHFPPAQTGGTSTDEYPRTDR
jgi:two-component system sensor histidine kinase HydH